eukprot:Platyproteum_vivax@DN7527_c0_g3_i1.p1
MKLLFVLLACVLCGRGLSLENNRNSRDITVEKIEKKFKHDGMIQWEDLERTQDYQDTQVSGIQIPSHLEETTGSQNDLLNENKKKLLQARRDARHDEFKLKKEEDRIAEHLQGHLNSLARIKQLG